MTGTLESTTTKTSHNWELYKENAAPLERGRNASQLAKVLSSPTCESTKVKKDDDLNLRKFETLIRPSEKFSKYYTKKVDQREELLLDKKKRQRNHEVVNHEIDVDELLVKCKVDKDPIIHWLTYIKYHEEAYPSDTHAQFLLMERCMHSLFHIPKYKNDVRYVRVCVLYADKTSNPHEQFKFYHKHKVGECVAIFWLAWAWVAETKKDFPFAEKIFSKALQKEAKPVKVIHARHKQFLRRMSRHFLNKQQEEQQLRELDDDGADYDDENDVNRRGVLTGLTEEGVRQNNRSTGVNAFISRGGNVHQRQGNNSENDNNGVKPNSAFSVFTDENEVNNDDGGCNMISPNDENKMTMPRMVREKDRRKENTLSAEAWNERGGLKSNNFGYGGHDDGDSPEYEEMSSVARRWAGTGSEAIIAGGTSTQASFQVFVDEDCAKDNGTSICNTSTTAEVKRPVSRAGTKERTLRQRMDDCTMLREPLRTMSSLTDEEKKHAALKTSSQGDVLNNKAKYRRGESCVNEKRKTKDQSHHNGPWSFEESRAKIKYFTLASSYTNINKLQRHASIEDSTDDSCMDIDTASSFENITAEDVPFTIYGDENEAPSEDCNALNMTTCHDRKAPLNVTTLHGTICDTAMKKSNPSKVLFDVNTSFGNKSVISAANNTSIASSVINEREAVGIFDDREETVNTKFAARELSMMFSSPVVNESIKKSSSKTSTSKLLFSVHRNERFVNESNDSSTVELNDDVFSKYQAKNHETKQDELNSVFKIFEEVSSSEDSNEKSSTKSGFQIHEDDSDSDSSYPIEEENGDSTASLGDIKDLMAGINNNGTVRDTHDFQIYCNSSVCSGADDGAVLTDNIASIGGDLSCIFSANDSDTMHLQERVRQMSIKK